VCKIIDKIIVQVDRTQLRPVRGRRSLVAAAFDSQHFGRVLRRLCLQHLIDDSAVADAEQRADQSRVCPVAAAVIVTGYRTSRWWRGVRRTGGPSFVVAATPSATASVLLVLAATVFFGYVPDHAVFQREPALARQARKRLFLRVGAHVPAQVLGRVETVQTERAQNLRNQKRIVGPVIANG
jgi:hypothetical protein